MEHEVMTDSKEGGHGSLIHLGKKAATTWKLLPSHSSRFEVATASTVTSTRPQISR